MQVEKGAVEGFVGYGSLEDLRDGALTERDREEVYPVDLINATPHEIVLVSEMAGSEVVIPPSGILPRIEEKRESRQHFTAFVDGDVLTVAVNKVTPGSLGGLPPEEGGKAYIVSRMVAESDAGRRRADLFVPDGIVRDEGGRIIGCRAFARIS